MAVACFDIVVPENQNGLGNPLLQGPAAKQIHTAAAQKRTQWFAVRTKPRHEKITDFMLQNKGYATFLPLYKPRRCRPGRNREVSLPLFPGYLFCSFDCEARLPILTTPGVLYVVGVGRNPAPVPDAEVDNVRRLVGCGLATEPWQYLELGQKVQIIEGPLKGVSGVLTAFKNEHRLVVSVDLLRRAVAVEIDNHWASGATVLE